MKRKIRQFYTSALVRRCVRESVIHGVTPTARRYNIPPGTLNTWRRRACVTGSRLRTSQRIIDYVCAHPGVTAREIARALNLVPVNNSNRLWYLVRTSRLVRQGLRYFDPSQHDAHSTDTRTSHIVPKQEAA